MKVENLKVKCDKCNYKEENIQFNELSKYVNKPCPKCGDVLVTIEEYNTLLFINNSIKNINKISNILKWINPFYYIGLIFGSKVVERTFTCNIKKR